MAMPDVYTSQQIFYSGGYSSGGYGGYGGCTNSICDVAQTFLYLINDVLVPLLFAVAFIVFLYGVFKKYILSHGDSGAVEEGHRLILWGLIGFAVMVSLWGLVNVVTNTFRLDRQLPPRLPFSPSAQIQQNPGSGSVQAPTPRQIQQQVELQTGGRIQGS